jgi:hypothetical protein
MSLQKASDSYIQFLFGQRSDEVIPCHKRICIVADYGRDGHVIQEVEPAVGCTSVGLASDDG